MVTFEQVKNSQEINTYISQADAILNAIGYTEHAHAHMNTCVAVVEYILEELGYDERTVELAKIAAYMHDIGNVINRADHAQSGAVMAFRILDKMCMDPKDNAEVISAIGNHDEKTAYPVNALAAALILGDKTDVRRSRVRKDAKISEDIHDRVNYAVEKSNVVLDIDNKEIELILKVDSNICAVMEYFEIFLDRMLLCSKAAEYFGLHFRLNINGSVLL
ncbi:MAG: HD domain-containing protein [Clostridia bacterium]|nr:HD domain-containing protein [Clostridia bacterium]